MTMNRRFFLGAGATTLATMAGALPSSAFAQKAVSSSGSAQNLAYGSVSELRALLDARKVSAIELF